ncbi:hypothetical protein SNEBB_009668 [Seison nebaliae]|nr:hypothetical protein SNEBB_009668 [Seison nebaliae]
MLYKLDNRIRLSIENGIKENYRTLFVVVGNKAQDQIVTLHQLLGQARIESRPSVLWCFHEKLAFSNNRQKKKKQIENRIRTLGKTSMNKNSSFETFISSTNIRYCYYGETEKILGETFGMLILQDFHHLTPNVLARTIETIEGGGLIVLLMNEVDELKNSMKMNGGNRYKYRLICSMLKDCPSSLVLSDRLNVIEHRFTKNEKEMKKELSLLSSKSKKEEEELLLKNFIDKVSVGDLLNKIVKQSKTMDQGKCLMKLIGLLKGNIDPYVITLTAGRGRGKSALLGLLIGVAIQIGFSNIYVTAPSISNVRILFEFILKSFDQLNLEEHVDYELLTDPNLKEEDDGNGKKVITQINIFRNPQQKQIVQFLPPNQHEKISATSELLIIDEAAAIPITLTQQLLKNKCIRILSSTTDGYEGTGRVLSQKLFTQLTDTTTKGNLIHFKLNKSIRFADDDPIEKWLNNVLCLNSGIMKKYDNDVIPVAPHQCELYEINRDLLFSYVKEAEGFLQCLMNIYVSAHYKNTPNDLQMLGDNENQILFALCSPSTEKSNGLPHIYTVIQAGIEGDLNANDVEQSFNIGNRESGNLIPWLIAQQVS